MTVIDGATNNTTTVAVGSSPEAIAVNPNTNQIYVANTGSNNVTVIDGATNNTTTIPTGTEPLALAVNPNTNQIYVANADYSTGGGNSVTVIDGATNTTTTVADGYGPYALAVNPNTNKIYVANLEGGNGTTDAGGNTVTVIDGATNNTTTITVGYGPRAIAVNPNTNQIYVANLGDNGGAGVTVIDGATNNTTTLLTANNPYAIAVNAVTNKIYVADNNPNSNTVTLIDGATNEVVLSGGGFTGYGNNSDAIAVNAVTNQIYVANQTSNAVSRYYVMVIDGNDVDFTVVPNPSSAKITAGQSATFMLTVTPQPSFASPISFSCNGGLPTLAGCTFSPATVTPNTSAVTTALTITTAAPAASLALPSFGHRLSPLYAIWLVIPAMLLGTVGMIAPKRRKLLSYCLVFLLASGCLLQVACSGTANGGGGGGGYRGYASRDLHRHHLCRVSHWRGFGTARGHGDIDSAVMP